MLLRQTLIRFMQLGVKIFDLLAQPGKSFLGYVGHLRIRGDALQERIHLLNALRGDNAELCCMPPQGIHEVVPIADGWRARWQPA